MDTPGVTAREIKHKLSLRASVTGELVLDDVRLPADAALPEARGLQGAAVLPDRGPLRHRLGRARRGPRLPGDRARVRRRPGSSSAGRSPASSSPRPSSPTWRSSCRRGYLLALHLGRLADAGRLRPEQVSVGKLNNVREALAIARQCRTILGANGISREYPVMRHANNLETVLTYEGTSEIHQLVIGQRLTGLSAFA